jgi:hypothetical protein
MVRIATIFSVPFPSKLACAHAKSDYKLRHVCLSVHSAPVGCIFVKFYVGEFLLKSVAKTEVRRVKVADA